MHFVTAATNSDVHSDDQDIWDTVWVSKPWTEQASLPGLVCTSVKPHKIISLKGAVVGQRIQCKDKERYNLTLKNDFSQMPFRWII